MLLLINQKMSKRGLLSQVPMKYTKSRLEREKSQIRIKQKLQQPNYFCHFSNAMYMGGIRAFKKNGKGLIIHDDGSSGIVSYTNDVPTGHHIVFRDGSILSKIYHLSRKTDIALRLNKYLIYVPFNEDEVPDGDGILIDFQHEKVHSLIYKRGHLKQKRIWISPNSLNQIFQNNSLKGVLPEQHASTFQMKFEAHQNIQIVRDGQKYTIGFGQRGRFPNGLSFKIFMNQSSKRKEDSSEFQTYSIERGQYQDQLLNGLGEKHFRNGNLYYGWLEKGEFEGRGLLSESHKSKWVYGLFKNGTLSQILEVGEENSQQRWRKVMKNLHSDDEKWIDLNVSLASSAEMQELLQQSLKADDDSSKVKEKMVQREKAEKIMKKIQEDFLFGNSDLQTSGTLQIAKAERSKSRSNSQGSRSRQRRFSIERKHNLKSYESTKSRQKSQRKQLVKSKSKGHKQMGLNSSQKRKMNSKEKISRRLYQNEEKPKGMRFVESRVQIALSGGKKDSKKQIKLLESNQQRKQVKKGIIMKSPKTQIIPKGKNEKLQGAVAFGSSQKDSAKSRSPISRLNSSKINANPNQRQKNYIRYIDIGDKQKFQSINATPQNKYVSFYSGDLKFESNVPFQPLISPSKSKYISPQKQRKFSQYRHQTLSPSRKTYTDKEVFPRRTEYVYLDQNQFEERKVIRQYGSALRRQRRAVSPSKFNTHYQ